MPNRMLRDWTNSDKINSLKADSERFFTRLIMKVDDYGCFYADTRLLRANLFPLLVDNIQEADLLQWMAECEKAGLIILYENANKKYIQIVDFGQRLDKARSRFPFPNGNEVTPGGYVYLIGEENSTEVKIGFSLNPWARLKEIKSAVKKNVVLKMQFKGTIDNEKQFHELLRKFNTKGEWFKLSEQLLTSFLECYENKMNATQTIVVIRNNSSRAELEVEVEPEVEKKKKLTPKGVEETVVSHPDHQSTYVNVEKNKVAICDFIKRNNPNFIEPYADLWNLFAGEKSLPKISKISNSRRRKFKVRINEPGFDFLAILKKASQSEFLLTGKWFGFDWIFENDSNYVKIIEGSYDKNNDAKVVKISTAEPLDITYLFERFQEGQLDKRLILPTHYEILNSQNLVSISEKIIEQRMKNLIGSNNFSETQLYDDYLNKRQTKLISKDLPVLMRIAVIEYFKTKQKSKNYAV